MTKPFQHGPGFIPADELEVAFRLSSCFVGAVNPGFAGGFGPFGLTTGDHWADSSRVLRQNRRALQSLMSDYARSLSLHIRQ